MTQEQQQRIAQWLANPRRPYTEGVELFGLVASKAQLRNYLGGYQAVRNPRPHDAIFAVLINQLVAIAGGSATPAEESVKIPEDEKPSNSPREITPDKLPQWIKVDYARAQELTPLIASLHASLQTLPTDEARRLQAIELKQTVEEREACWARVHDYLADNALIFHRGSGLLEGETPETLRERLRRMRYNVKRAADQLDRHSSDPNAKELHLKAQHRLDRYRTEVTNLETRLRAATQ